MNDTPTPRTDAEHDRICELWGSKACDYDKMKDFSCQIERELAAARKEIKGLHFALKQSSTIYDVVTEQRDDALAESIRWMCIAEGRGRTDDEEQLAIVTEQRDRLAKAFSCSGQTWYQIAEEMKLDCRQKERELTAVTEQRDEAREQHQILYEQTGNTIYEARKQRDEARRLAEKYRYLSCDSLEEADETLLPWEITTTNEP